MSFQIFLLHISKSNEAEYLAASMSISLLCPHGDTGPGVHMPRLVALVMVSLQQLDPKSDGYLGIMDAFIGTGIGQNPDEVFRYLAFSW